MQLELHFQGGETRGKCTEKIQETFYALNVILEILDK